MMRDSVLVSDGAARDHGWHAGDTLRLGYPDTGEHAVTIAATYAAMDLLDADVITTIAADEAWSTRPQDRQVLVKLRGGVDFAAARALIEATIASHPTVEVHDAHDVKQSYTSRIDSFLAGSSRCWRWRS